MSKTTNKIKRERPDASEDVLGIAEELDEKHALAALADTEGGKVLIATYLKAIAQQVDALSTRYRDATHTELIVLCADLSASLASYRELKRARKQKEYLEQVLADALAE